MADKPPRIGELITKSEARDAIHVAVMPVLAREYLKAGEHVGVFYEPEYDVYLASKTADAKIGIVDPYLTVKVKEGDSFWLFLYPNTITSLRHNWTHPDLPDVEPKKDARGDIDGEHTKWIEHFANQYGQSFSDMMFAAENYLKNGARWNEGSTFEGEYVPNEFWDHYEAVKNIKVEENDRGSFFSCSC